jgi:hypothetical protein
LATPKSFDSLTRCATGWTASGNVEGTVAEHAIAVAVRYFKRQFEKAVGRSILKVLTELITNADDSYRRLTLSPGSSGADEIVVEFDRRKRQFAVIDQAEGLTGDEMVENFVTYGADSGDRAAGVATRSLFGKGLRDVLFTQDDGLVRSIKDGRAYICKFRWRDKAGNERPVVDIAEGPSVTDELRRVWGIRANGTRVQFRLRQDVASPLYDRLARDLENFYMLRVITTRSDRRVTFRSKKADGGWESQELHHSPPAASSSVPLGNREWVFTFEGIQISASVDLQAFVSELVQGEHSYEDREGGLLVVDEDDTVLDLTLFGFDPDPAASRLFGTLRLVGAGGLIRTRLNAPEPEEILTETRDGFDRKHPFYRQLRAEIDPWLKPFVDSERQRMGSKLSGLSEDTRKRHERAFEKLNTMYRKLLGESSGLGSGPKPASPHTDLPLEFRSARVNIQTGASKAIQLLVNTLLIPPGQGLAVTSDDPTIAGPILPELEIPTSTDTNEPTVSIPIRIEGFAAGDASVRARAQAHEARVECAVADEELPDLNSGLAFFPESVEVRDGERAHLTLYTDLRVVGRSDTPELETSNPKVDLVGAQPRWEPVTAFIVRTRIAITGRGKGEEALITARLGDAEAVALVQVVSARKKERPKGGLFRGYKFGVHERKVQAILDTEGYLIINLADPTNHFHFGHDVASATKAVTERSSSQTLLADLILNECLYRAVSEAYTKGKLKIRFPDEPVTDIRNYVADLQFEVGADIHKLFVATSSGT